MGIPFDGRAPFVNAQLSYALIAPVSPVLAVRPSDQLDAERRHQLRRHRQHRSAPEPTDELRFAEPAGADGQRRAIEIDAVASTLTLC
jgi:hypothetical protein